MRLEFSKDEDGIDWKEVFKHGCFSDDKIGITYECIESKWVENKDGSLTRFITKAKLLSVSINSIKK